MESRIRGFDYPTRLMKQLNRRFLEDTLDIAPAGLEFCFDRDYFLTDDFRVDAFILDQQRRGVGLERTRDSLLQYANIIKSSLIELINQDYADFVSLSTNLVGLDRTINQLAQPLQCFKVKLEAAITDLDQVEQYVQHNLQARHALDRKKQLLTGLQTVIDCLARLESWLTLAASKESPRVNRASPIVDENEALVLGLEEDEVGEWPEAFLADSSVNENSLQRSERIANEFTKMQFYLSKCQDNPMAQSLKPQIQRITSTLARRLEHQLEQALTEAHLIDEKADLPDGSRERSVDLRQLVSIYQSANRMSDFYAVYRQRALRSALTEIFAPCAELSAGFTNMDESRSKLQAYYSSALRLLDRQLDLLDRCCVGERQLVESHDPLRDVDLLTEAFWPETVDLICAHLSGIFTPGNPDRFCALYSVSIDFLDQLEARAVDCLRPAKSLPLDKSPDQAISQLSRHPAYAKFTAKWSLPVYFQMRLQDITKVIDEALDPKNNLNSSNEQNYNLLATNQLVEQIERCWQDGIFIPTLRSRFWKLTLQLLNRYSVFARQRIDTINAEPTTPSDQASGLIPDHLTSLLVDCCQLSVGYCRTRLPQLIANRLNGPDSSLPDWMIQAIDESCSRLDQCVDRCCQSLVGHFKQSIAPLCQQVSDIARRYRGTNRSMPTTPSLYANQLIELTLQMTSLLDTVATSNPVAMAIFMVKQTISDKLNQTLQQAIDCFVDLYSCQLTDAVSAVRKTEDLMRKMRQAKHGSDSASQQVVKLTDSDKIYHQLFLDLSAVRDQLTDAVSAVRKTEDLMRKMRQAKHGSDSASQQVVKLTDSDKIYHQLFLDLSAVRDQLGKITSINGSRYQTQFDQLTVNLTKSSRPANE